MLRDHPDVIDQVREERRDDATVARLGGRLMC
jgi:hypothetical protein